MRLVIFPLIDVKLDLDLGLSAYRCDFSFDLSSLSCSNLVAHNPCC